MGFILEEHTFHFKSPHLLHTENKKNLLHLCDSFIQQGFKSNLHKMARMTWINSSSVTQK